MAELEATSRTLTIIPTYTHTIDHKHNNCRSEHIKFAKMSCCFTQCTAVLLPTCEVELSKGNEFHLLFHFSLYIDMSLIQCVDINTLSCIRHRELYSPVFVPDTSVELDNMKSIVIKCIITNVNVLNCIGFIPMIM